METDFQFIFKFTVPAKFARNTKVHKNTGRVIHMNDVLSPTSFLNEIHNVCYEAHFCGPKIKKNPSNGIATESEMELMGYVTFLNDEENNIVKFCTDHISHLEKMNFAVHFAIAYSPANNKIVYQKLEFYTV